MQRERFTITEQHIKLLKRMYISWEDCEFGAPSVDCKRPYGNGDVYRDIAEIIGIPLPDRDNGEDFTESQFEQMDTLHAQMRTVLQIGVRTLKFEVGTYECDLYSNWVKVS